MLASHSLHVLSNEPIRRRHATWHRQEHTTHVKSTPLPAPLMSGRMSAHICAGTGPAPRTVICTEPAGLTGDDFVSIRVVECDGINNVLVPLQHMPVTAAPPTCAVCPRSSVESTGMPIARDHGACPRGMPHAVRHVACNYTYRESRSARDTTHHAAWRVRMKAMHVSARACLHCAAFALGACRKG